MDVPLEIAFHNMDRSEAIERRVRERAVRLERFHKGINSCRVVVEAPHRSEGGPQGYHVTIDVTVPGEELAVSRDPGDRERHHDPYLAVKDAFEAMEKRLESRKEKRRHDVKSHPAPLQGRVLRMFPDHGFVATNDGREIYFHRNAVAEGRFDDIRPEDAVELVIVHGESPEGPQATTVKPIRDARYVDAPPRR